MIKYLLKIINAKLAILLSINILNLDQLDLNTVRFVMFV